MELVTQDDDGEIHRYNHVRLFEVTNGGVFVEFDTGDELHLDDEIVGGAYA